MNSALAKWIAVIFMTVVSLWPTQRVHCQDFKFLPNCPLHIIIALDFSASEVDFVYKLQDALSGITKKLQLHPSNLRIGIITFNRGADMIVPLTGVQEQLERGIATLQLPYLVFATDIHESIKLAALEFKQNSVTGVPKYFVLVSDGDPHAHMRGRGFQEDIIWSEQMKNGKATGELIHMISVYSGRENNFNDEFDEAVRKASYRHMQNLASSEDDVYSFGEMDRLVRFFIQRGSCF